MRAPKMTPQERRERTQQLADKRNRRCDAYPHVELAPHRGVLFVLPIGTMNRACISYKCIHDNNWSVNSFELSIEQVAGMIRGLTLRYNAMARALNEITDNTPTVALNECPEPAPFTDSESRPVIGGW